MGKAATHRKKVTVRRQGRRVMPAVRRKAQRKRPATSRAPLTVGALIAAAYETAGGELSEVLALVTSPQMSRALGRRIVLVG